MNGAPPSKSCGALSLVPTERDTAATSTFLVKPLGDDGVLQTSVSVAVSGLYASATPGGTPELKVEPDPSCVGITFPSDERYIDFQAGVTDPNDAARRFRLHREAGQERLWSRVAAGVGAQGDLHHPTVRSS